MAFVAKCALLSCGDRCDGFSGDRRTTGHWNENASEKTLKMPDNLF